MIVVQSIETINTFLIGVLWNGLKFISKT